MILEYIGDRTKTGFEEILHVRNHENDKLQRMENGAPKVTRFNFLIS